jgi:MATE family multidrug resistance protein
MTLPPLLTASYVGRHLGSIHLDGFTLANLTGNLFTLSLISGLYSASDTLSPQAFGAGNFQEVGLLAIRGFAGAMMLVIPINLLLILFMDKFLMAIGQDEEPARLASQWYQIYALALPFFALYNITWKFLSSQEIMVPLVVVLALTLMMLPFWLDGLVTAYGFVGSALAILIYQVSQVCLLMTYLWWHKPHQEGTWPGIGAWRLALEWKPLRAYLSLGMGGILSASEWIYWEILGLMVGTLGKLPLAVHTVPTQVLSMAFMIPLGIGMALSIRLGQTLPRSVKRAKQLVAWTLGSTCVLVTMMSAGMYLLRFRIYHIFTNEQDVLDGCDLIWPKALIYSWSLAMFAVCMGIASGLGMQWTLGAVTFICLWIVGLPAVWYFAIYREGGIQVVWSCVYPPYLIMDMILVYRFYVADWDAISHEIRIREHIENEQFDGSQMKSYGAVDEGNAFLTED